jgi:hypothetical protein
MAILNATAMFLELNREKIVYVVLSGGYVKLKEYEKHRELKQKEDEQNKKGREPTCRIKKSI